MLRSTIYPILFSIFAATLTATAQPVQFARLSETVEASPTNVTAKEAMRYERFLSAVFPVRPMKRFAHESDQPVVRRVAYTVLEQNRQKFIIAAFTSRWKSAINTLAIYRVSDGPIQVWRSLPWEATFYDMHFTTASSGSRALILFREGGDGSTFGLASVFAFKNTAKGIQLEDLTPYNSLMRVSTRFPFRPMLAQDIRLHLADDSKAAVMLTASDESFYLAGTTPVRPTIEWRFDRSRNRFERMKSTRDWTRQATTAR